MFGPGIYNVTYVATDSSKNQATCKFTVDVKGIDRTACVNKKKKKINTCITYRE